MRSPEERSYPCSEPDCSGIVSVEEGSIARIQTGCQRFSPAVRCSSCGRLYWVSLDEDNGTRVYNRQYEAAFWTPEQGLENRPMRTEEKLTIIKTIIEAAKDRSPTDIGHTRDILAMIVRKGHAPDCPGNDNSNKSLCECGIVLAEEWIRDHSAKSSEPDAPPMGEYTRGEQIACGDDCTSDPE